MADVDAVVARLRHELRTPINAILGYSELLLEEESGERFGRADRHGLAQLAAAGRQLLRVVNAALAPAGIPPHDVQPELARLGQEMRQPLSTAREHVAMLLDRHRDDSPGSPGGDLRRIHSALLCLAGLVDSLESSAPDSILAGNGEPLRPAAAGCGAATGGGDADGREPPTGTILVIDDEEANRTLLARRLARQGHAVLTAASGEAGIAEAASRPVDVILLDVLMPGISGYDVLARLKEDARLREIPVLMITAVDGSASVTRCIALGADDYLAKPFDALVLAARVGACVAKKRARDFELAYLRGVATVTAAAAAVESGCFVPSSLDTVAAQPDALGQLARLFQRMAVEVATRERRLQARVDQLTIAIDERKKAAQVREITESDYFRDLKARARHFSARRAARTGRDD
jgi:DNA-binding response OmpR family regulator